MKKITIIWAAVALALPVLTLPAIADEVAKGASASAVSDSSQSKEAKKAAKAAEKRVREEAEKASDEAKKAEKAAAKQAKKEAKKAAKAEKEAQKQAEKEAKAAAKAQKDSQEQSGKETKAEKKARKQAEKEAKAAAKAEKKILANASKQAEKEAKAAAKLEKQEAKLAAQEARRSARANKIPKAERRVQQQQQRIEEQVVELNAMAERPELREDILNSIWREHQISSKRFHRQLEAHPELGVGGLLVANLISRFGQKGLDEIITSGKEGQNWGQIARKYNVNLVELINETYRVGITARTLDLIKSQSPPAEPKATPATGA